MFYIWFGKSFVQEMVFKDQPKGANAIQIQFFADGSIFKESSFLNSGEPFWQ